jgi:hypothetical protein
LWEKTIRPGFFAELPAMLDLSTLGSYRFYGILVGIAYTFYGKYDFNFALIFPIAIIVAMLVEELFIMTKLYKITPTVKSIMYLITWSAACAIASTAGIIMLIKKFGYAGQPATIIGVILLKLIQPLGSQLFVYRFKERPRER